MSKWEHAVLVLEIKKKGFAVSRKGLLEGIAEESRAALEQMGNEGWELVTALPFMSGSVGMFSSSKTSTDAFIAFFKRQII
jgi:hypothetical protein